MGKDHIKECRVKYGYNYINIDARATFSIKNRVTSIKDCIGPCGGS